MSEVEVKPEKFPWLLVIVLGAAFGFFGTAWFGFLPSSIQRSYNLGSVGCCISITTAPFIPILLWAPLSRVKALKDRMNMTTLTIIYTSTLVSSYFITAHFPWISLGNTFAERIAWPIETSIVPLFMAPGAEICSQCLLGGVPIPWAEWLPTISFWWLIQVLMGFFMLSIATIFRREWIDVEKVPFPTALVAYESVAIPALKLQSRTKFIVGMLIGIVAQMPIFLQALFPWFPDIYGWRTGTCGNGASSLASNPALAGIVGLDSVNKQPLAFPIAYLIPQSVLLSTLLWYLTFVILHQAAYAMGYYTGIETVTDVCCRWNTYVSTNEPFKAIVPTYVGGFVGIALFYLYRTRRSIADTIRTALHRSDEWAEIEKDEPIRYRTSYMMLTISTILLAAFFMVSGVSLLRAALLIVTVFITWFAQAYVFGRTSFQMIGDSYGMWPFKFFNPVVPDVKTLDYALPVYFSRTFGADQASYGWGGVLFSSFASYRFAKLAGVRNDNVLKASAVTIVVTPLAVLFVYISLLYAFGNRLGPWFTGGGIYGYSTTFYDTYPATEPWILQMVAGILITGAVTLLHARFIWFPLEPIGFIVGFGQFAYEFGYWSTILVAWVLKTATLRIGGSKAYEEIGVPIATGIVAGCMLTILLGGIAGIMRFFIPF